MPAEFTKGFFPDLLRLRAARSSADVAFRVDGGGVLTVAEWDRRADAVASGLTARGVRPGEVVAIASEPTAYLDYAVAHVGVQRAGCVVLPLTGRLKNAEDAAMLKRAGALSVIAVGERHSASRARTWSLSEVEAPRSRGEPPGGRVGPSEPGLILHSSGTTGTPKFVVRSHALLSFMASEPYEYPAECEPPTPGSESLSVGWPISSGSGQYVFLRALGRWEYRVTVLPSLDARRFWQVVAERGIGELYLSPAMANVLTRASGWEGVDRSSVQGVLLGGAHAPAALLARLQAVFPRARIVVGYASVESGPARTRMAAGRGPRGSVGKPVGTTEVRVVDDSGAEVECGTVGEILLRERSVPPAWYLDDPRANQEVFLTEGWVRTGDLGYVNSDGFLFLVDRKKDVINRGGVKVSSIMVEEAACDCPLVEEIAAFGVRDAIYGEEVAVAVVLRENALGEAEATVRGFLQARLRPEHVPRFYFFVDALPRNEAGKVEKRRLAERCRPPAGR